jgi:5-methylcytosine-specific restriction endonuclease McrA
MDQATRQLVRQRANFRCEYCQLAEANSPLAKLQIEHVRPRRHGGGDNSDNLALACIDCNLRKGPNLSGIDPVTDALVALFDPRHQTWSDHFVWRGLEIAGPTDVG